jgi:hypothetical protein
VQAVATQQAELDAAFAALEGLVGEKQREVEQLQLQLRAASSAKAPLPQLASTGAAW